ncbi:MAG: uncharacterized protein JWN79_855 [Gemmatimonadetes bacterium]|jgi:uncharacterized protein (DUF1697 family)|nr:uncharacterized protein [Gemmatimonadota bacterium]
MPRYVALLRAINVGGRVVKMDRLRQLFTELGYTDVQTFIASGNVMFDAPDRNVAALERAIEGHLRAALGYDVETFVRTAAELATIASLEPFGADTDEGRTVYVAFLREPPPASYLERLMSFQSGTDDFRVIARESYWSCTGRMSDSPYGKAKPDRETVSTSRNMTTVRKLAALAARPSS